MKISLGRRLGTFGIGLVLILFGLAKLQLEPAGMYENYWGGFVYSPFIILAGAIAVIAAFVQKTDSAVLKPGDTPVEFPHEAVGKEWKG